MSSQGRVASLASVTDVRQRWRAHFTARVLRPFALTSLAGVFGLVVLAGGGVWQGVVASGVVYAPIVYRAVSWARRQAWEEFLASYADSRGLADHREPDLAPVVPLLAIGDARWVERLMAGVLPGGLEGVLGWYAYEEQRGGERRAKAHAFTVVVSHVPQATEKVLEVYCEPHANRSSSGVEGFRRRNQLRLESVAFDERYDVFFGRGDDENRLHQLYTPSFIVWLTDSAPSGFGFQLSHGCLCVFVPGYAHSATCLDGLCEAAATVARRLQHEASE